MLYLRFELFWESESEPQVSELFVSLKRWMRIAGA